MGEKKRGGGSGVFQVMASQLLSAVLWGGTPDSEGEPCCSISTLLHFLSLKPLVLEGAWESILTSGGQSSFLACLLCLRAAAREVSDSVFLITQI